jgi:hypothetical protein
VIGFGGGETEEPRGPGTQGQQQGGYDPTAPIKVMGYGPLTERDIQGLTEVEKRTLIQR